jgi:hypothetical protein
MTHPPELDENAAAGALSPPPPALAEIARSYAGSDFFSARP